MAAAGVLLDEHSPDLAAELLTRLGGGHHIAEESLLRLLRAQLAHLLGEPHQALELADEIDLTSLGGLQLDLLLSHGLLLLAEIRGGLGITEQAVELRAQQHPALRRLLSPAERAAELGMLAYRYGLLGDEEGVSCCAAQMGALLSRLPKPKRALVQTQLGYALVRLDRYAPAFEQLHAAHRLYTELDDRPGRMEVQVILAEMAVRLGDLKLAERLTSELAQVKGLPPGVRSLGQNVQATCAWARGDVPQAMRRLRSALRIEQRQGCVLAEAGLWGLLSEIGAELPSSVGWARRGQRMRLGLVAALDDQRTKLALMARTRNLGVRLVQRLRQHRGIGEILSAVQEAKAGEFLRRVQDAPGSKQEQELLQQVRAGANQPEAAGLGLVAEEDPRVRQRGQAAIRLYHSLTRAPGIARELRIRPAAIQRKLARGQVAIEYYRPDPDGDELLLFLIRRERLELLTVPWRLEHTEAMRHAADVVSGAVPLAGPASFAALQQSLRRLDEVLVQPVEGELSGATRLLLAPGASLLDVPFEALLDRHDLPLLERSTLTFLVSTAQLAYLPAGAGARSPRFSRALLLRGQDDASARLRHADREMAEIRALLLGTGRVELCPVPDRAGLAAALAAADLVHYAGHARFDGSDGEAAVLHLPGGALGPGELRRTRLPRRPLLVWSGCETGRVATVGDEFVGFLRSSFLAGARCVVCSSWAADDEATAELMRRFYRGLVLERRTASESLALANRALRRLAPHPSFWCNFRLYGAT